MSTVRMGLDRRQKLGLERRQKREITFVERRRGRAWMYGQIGICVGLVAYLAWLLR